MTVAIDPGAPLGSTITNQASVTSSTVDPTTSNNSAQVVSTVNAQTDLAVTKSISQDPNATNPPDGPCAPTTTAGVASSPKTASPAAPEVAAPSQHLPFTGGDIIRILAFSALLIAGGLAVRLSAPRRRRHHQ